MCDYGGAIDEEISQIKLIEQVDNFIDMWRDEPSISLSALGCFFDEQEVPRVVREYLFNKIRSDSNIKYLCVETRAEDICALKLSEAMQILGDVGLEVGLGVESANDFVRNVCINKGVDRLTIEASVSAIHNAGADVVLHVLLKPPFLDERESIEDAVNSIEYCADLKVKRVVLMAGNVKMSTFSGWLYERGHYKPPWLWTILEVLKTLSPEAQKITSVYGFKCGIPMLDIASNCSKCTKKVRDYIDKFCCLHDPRIIETAANLSCECKLDWQQEISKESSTSPNDRFEFLCGMYEAEFSLVANPK